MSCRTPDEPPTCPRCQNQRLIPREPGAKLLDGRPDLIACPRCGGAGPVAVEAGDKMPTEPDVDHEKPVPVQALKPACFEARAGLKDHMVDALEAVQARCLAAAGMVPV